MRTRSVRGAAALFFLGVYVTAAATEARAADVKCAIIQFSDQYPHEVSQDADRLESFVRTAAGNGAKIIVAPENCLYRYDPWDQGGVTELDLANTFQSLVTRFSSVANELNVCIVFGTREPSGDGAKPTYQSAVFIDNNGNLLKTYRKRVPSNSELSFTKGGGNDWTPFDTPYGKVWMQICKDMDGDGYVNSMPTNIDLFIGVNKDANRGWVKVDAGCLKAGCYGIGANWAGDSGTEGGNSGFVDTNGNMISEAGSGNNGANEKIIYEVLPLGGGGAPTVITAPADGTVLVVGQQYTLTGSGEGALTWSYDANSDGQVEQTIGTGSSVAFTIPTGITDPMTMTIFLNGDGGKVSKTYDVSDPGGGNNPPTVNLTASPASGDAPLAVSFDAGSSDPDGDSLTHEWDWDYSGTFAADLTTDAVKTADHTYNAAGTHTAAVRVSDGQETVVDTVTITVSAVADSDGDGLPDAWELLYFGDLSQGRDDDFDLDGASNYAEYTAGTDPTDETDYPGSGTIVIVCSDMDLTGYAVGSDGYIETMTTGTATASFPGATGRYRIEVVIVKEDDGQPTLDVYVGGALVSTINYQLGAAARDPQTVDLGELDITSGTEIKLVGTLQGGAAARVDRIIFTPTGSPGNSPPTVSLSASPTSGDAPLAVSFDAGSSDPDGDTLTHEWDWDYDGSTFTVEGNTGATATATQTYDTEGTYTAAVRVDDGNGHAVIDTVTITVTFEDSDGDGLPDSWEQLHFGDLSQGADDDFDLDGASNYEEYTGDTDPTDGTSYPPPSGEGLSLCSPAGPSGPRGAAVALVLLASALRLRRRRACREGEFLSGE